MTEDSELLLEQLLELAQGAGIEIRLERFGRDAATCHLKGKKVIFLDPEIAPRLKVAALAQELSQCSWEGLYLRPRVRELLETE